MRPLMRLSALLLAASVVACSTTEESSEPNPFCNSAEGVPGGWQDGVVDEQSVQAMAFILERMDNFAGLEEILAVKKQVVAGTNYAIDFRLVNEQVWHAQVFSNLQGKMSMVGEPQKGSMTDNCP